MSVRKSKNGTWEFEACITDETGTHRYHRRGFVSKQQALEKERLFILKCQQNKNFILVLHDCVEGYLEFLAHTDKISTIDSKRYILKEFEAYLGSKKKMSTITSNDLLNFQDMQVKKQVSNARINKKMLCIKKMLIYANDFLDIQNESYQKIVHLKEKVTLKEDKHIEEDIFNRFLESFDATDQHKKIIFEIMYKAGLRIAEVQALQWSDINFQTRTLQVTKQAYLSNKQYILIDPKSAKSIRRVDICNSLYNLLLERYNEKSKIRGFKKDWYVISDLKIMPEQTINNVRKKYCDRIGYYFTNHECRHSYGSNLLARGFDIKYVSEMMGHNSLAVTLSVYHHLLDSVRNENKDRLMNF